MLTQSITTSDDTVEAHQMINSVKSEHTPVTAQIERGNITALIIDDSQFDRMKIRRLFSTSGLPFHLNETDGLTTLQDVLNQQQFDVILVDYNLPDTNGMDVLKLVQNHPLNANAATIMITGHDQSEIAVQALKMGCTDYISKGQLSSERLKDSVLNAIEEVELARVAGEHQDHHTEELTRTIMTEYSKTLQPELAKIVRELRVLKASMADPTSNLPADLEAIERRCIRLWSVLTKPDLIPANPTRLQ